MFNCHGLNKAEVKICPVVCQDGMKIFFIDIAGVIEQSVRISPFSFCSEIENFP